MIVPKTDEPSTYSLDSSNSMAATCIMGHPHSIHSSHSSHHQLLAAILPPNTHIPHHITGHGGHQVGPHLSIFHEATRNHIQLALHSPSALGHFTLPSGSHLSLGTQAQQHNPIPHIPLSSPNLTYPAVPSVPHPSPPNSVVISSQSVRNSVKVSCSSSCSSNCTTTTVSSSSPTSTTPVFSPSRPPTHEPSELRTLYVGNLDASTSEDLLMAVFSHVGPVRSCKLIQEAGNDPYCFVEFSDRCTAENALHTMNKRLCLGKEMKINWATSPGTQGKVDTSTALYCGDNLIQHSLLHHHLQSQGINQQQTGGVITFAPHIASQISTPENCSLGSRLHPSSGPPPPRYKPQELAEHYHIFVGDLSPEIETFTLREAFAPFGEISDCRVVRDPHTLKSKGYGFVSFIKKADAETAITNMNGQWIGNRNIRTNWATRKPPAPKTSDANQKPLTFDDVYNQSSPTNCTVYCGGITNGLSEELMQKTFAMYGNIQEIRVFKEKGYAFVRFATKESATHAIVSVHNSEVNGQPVKCSWGKESGDPNNTPVSTQVMTLTDVSECLSLQPLPPGTQYPYNYPAGQVGYWYPQGYPTAAQVQSQPFLGMQGFTYGQYGYQQGMASMAGVPTAATATAAWQGVPQPQLPASAAAAAAAGQMATLQQPPSVVGAYPVQQFQLGSPYLLGNTAGTLVQ